MPEKKNIQPESEGGGKGFQSKEHGGGKNDQRSQSRGRKKRKKKSAADGLKILEKKLSARPEGCAESSPKEGRKGRKERRGVKKRYARPTSRWREETAVFLAKRCDEKRGRRREKEKKK